MFKNNLKKFITTLAVSAVTFGAIAPVANFESHTVDSTVHADSTVAADGPWETTGDSANLPLVQQVHNGNEIYYSIKPGDRNTNLFEESVSDWNALGVVHLVQVSWNDTRSQIAMGSAGWSDDNNYGTNGGGYQYSKGDTEAIMTNTTVTLYRDNSLLSKKDQLATADHELGHALGFAHDNRKLNNGRAYRNYRLTMYYTNASHTYKLGGIEQRTLADHYDIAPSNGYLDTNC